ncbi:MAG TPA: ArsA-related P-loop ATPase [Dehalococcoidia bacterium]|nr:ArsA-related P-loop ATPase [Dehalococcoidia bacterium]
MRIILFSGRGGSGVSTLSAATALAAAGTGRRTLVFGLGHGVGRALEATAKHVPQAVAPNLELVQGAAEDDEFREWLTDVLDFRDMDAELADDFASLPGINHIGRLLELESLISSGNYDVAVLDAAPLAMFLDLPGALEAAARWLERAFAPRQSSVFEPFVRPFFADYANAGEEVFETGRALLTRLASLRDLFTDHETTSVRLVVAPDHSAPGDLQEAAGVLSLFGYLKDAVVVTRLIPDEVTDPFFDPAKGREADVVAEVRKSTSAPVITCALRREAPLGESALLDVAREVYGDADPTAFLSQGEPWEFSKDGTNFVLRVVVPFASREELRLEQVDDGIIVHLNGRRRLFPMPQEAGRREASTWSHDGRVLKVTIE